jgi:uncharacterized protein
MGEPEGVKTMLPQWLPGDITVLRGLGQNKIWYALPVIVVQDTPDLIAVFWRAGTKGKWRIKATGDKVTPHDVRFTPLELHDRIWDKTDVLMLIPPSAAHAIYVMWEAGQHHFLCWYVNLQEPILRTPISIDTRDHWLDIVISPHKQDWNWKDEDQLAEVVKLGILTDQDARNIRAEGERVLAMLKQNAPPFCDGWENWLAPQEWGLPDLPPGWDHL